MHPLFSFHSNPWRVFPLVGCQAYIMAASHVGGGAAPPPQPLLQWQYIAKEVPH